MKTTVRAAAGCALAMALTGLVAWLSAEPMLFPSLGPTLMMLAQHPGQANTCPRSVMLAHTSGLVAGWLSLALCGLLGASSALVAGIDPPRIAAATLSVTGTVLATRLLRAPHPPAGATTLIVSLGFLPTLGDLGLMLVALAWATALISLFNRLTGRPAPFWRPSTPDHGRPH